MARSIALFAGGAVLLFGSAAAAYIALRRSGELPPGAAPPQLPPVPLEQIAAAAAGGVSAASAGVARPQAPSQPASAKDLTPADVRRIAASAPLPDFSTPPAQATPNTVVRTLRAGMSGSDVQALQQRLRELGYTVDVDGAFGSKTAAVVREFQSKNHIVVDGIVGPDTRGAINAAYAALLQRMGARPLGPANA